MKPKTIKPHGLCVSGYTGTQTSRPFEEWWALANERRAKLIRRDVYKKDLTFSQKRELKMLQEIAGLVIKYKPFCCEHHSKVCPCRCHLVGHKHKRDGNGRCTICLEKLEDQRKFFQRQKRADKLLATIRRNGGL